MNVNLKTPTQFKIASLLIEKAEELQMSLDDYTEIGYNSQSGYVYLWDECYSFTLGIADYAYNRSEKEVELILSCPETGAEFFSNDETDLYNQYREYCEESNIECYV